MAWEWDPAWFWEVFKLGGVAFGGYWFAERGRRNARSENSQDRRQALLESAQDRHRGELRQAYALFIQSTNEFIDSAGHYAFALRAVFAKQEALQASALEEGLDESAALEYAAKRVRNEQAISRAKGDGFMAALSRFARARNELLLIESDPTRVIQIGAVIPRVPLLPESLADADTYLGDVTEMQARASSFAKSLTGAFAPVGTPRPATTRT